MTRRKSLPLITTAALALLAGHAGAAAIGINFVGESDYTLAAGESAGAPDYVQSNWNNVTGSGSSDTLGNNSNLEDSTGTVTTADVTSNGFKDFGDQKLDLSATTPDEKLMDGLRGRWGGSLEITVSEIPYAEYQVIAYFDNPHDKWSVQEMAIGSETYYGYAPAVDDFSGTYTRTTATSDDDQNTPVGNYAVFNVTGSSFTLALEATSAQTDGQERAVISALQIVDMGIIPEPASLALLGLGGLLMVGRGRRSA